MNRFMATVCFGCLGLSAWTGVSAQTPAKQPTPAKPAAQPTTAKPGQPAPAAVKPNQPTSAAPKPGQPTLAPPKPGQPAPVPAKPIAPIPAVANKSGRPKPGEPTLAPPQPAPAAAPTPTPALAEPAAAKPEDPAPADEPSPTAPSDKATPTTAEAAQSDKPAADQTTEDGKRTYALRYKFQKGETIRWRTEHRSNIRSTVKGVTAGAESHTESVKVWKVSAVDATGNITFEHSVASIRMRQKHSGQSEVTYDSLTDKTPPTLFEDVHKSIGVPLTVVTMSAQGKVLRRERKVMVGREDGQLTMTLPEQPVAVGDEWRDPLQYQVKAPDGTPRPIKAQQLYRLTSVEHGIAVIELETQILTPISEPTVQAQLVQQETRGEVRFDIEAGRIVRQQYDLDKPVVGFSGQDSSMHCRSRFSEELLTEAPATARKE